MEFFKVFFFSLCMVFFLRLIRPFFKSSKAKFRIEFLYQLSLYIAEIFLMFSCFQLFLHLNDKPLGYDEKGTFKRFLDFFTAYQIFIFVVLKLYDSLKIDAYSSLMYGLDIVIKFVEDNAAVPEGFQKIDELLKMDGVAIPHETANEYERLHNIIIRYKEIRHKNTKSIREEKEKIKRDLYIMQASLSLAKEERDFHWNVSILQRIAK